MTKVIAENINSVLTYRTRIFWFLITGMIISSLFYAIFVHSAVINVIERGKILSEIRERSTAVSELESKYFNLKNRITMDMAHTKGFQDTEVSSYISKKSITAFVSHNEL